MKLVTGETMRQIDLRAISEFGVAGLDLMERAGRNCAEQIDALFGMEPLLKVLVVAGKGNNGGDGFVIARVLMEKGWEAEVLLLADPAAVSGDARENLNRLSSAIVFPCLTLEEIVRQAWRMEEATVVVDALFGTGLSSDVTGLHAAAIDLMNRAGRPILAVDIPSGVHAGSGRVLGAAVRAGRTVTFALPKLGHFLWPGAGLCGTLSVVDIGIPPEATADAEGVELLDLSAVAPLLRPRERGAHKGNFGHCLIVAGSTGKSGAAAMAANSAVRSGAGLVTAAVPATLNGIMEVKTTEAMSVPVDDGGSGYLSEGAMTRILELVPGRDAVAVGPGIGTNSSTALLVQGLVRGLSLPLVLDADALNALAVDLSPLGEGRGAVRVLTPHPGEMARLMGSTVSAVESDRIGAAVRFAAEFGVFLVLKGAGTVIAAPDGRVAINSTGNPGMATGGMGDVLTGLLVSLLGQGYDPYDACRIGVFAHGLAGDQVAAVKGEMGMSAVDVQEQLPSALKSILEAWTERNAIC